MRLQRMRLQTRSGTLDLTTRMAILLAVVTFLQTLPRDLPGVPAAYQPYVKALIAAIITVCVFLEKGPSTVKKP